jgi:hypothetical protein
MEAVGIKEREMVWRVENRAIIISPKAFEIFHA